MTLLGYWLAAALLFAVTWWAWRSITAPIHSRCWLVDYWHQGKWVASGTVVARDYSAAHDKAQRLHRGKLIRLEEVPWKDGPTR
jgi:hypothetical protein